MKRNTTILLDRHDIASILTIDDCIPAVETAFRLHAEEKAMTPKVLGIHSTGGGFHIKAGILNLSRNYFVAKVNANFPGNSIKYGLPTIQGVIIVMDADNGQLLALMDSIEITIIRTGGATGVAAKYLSLPDVENVVICGCGNQGKISLKAVMAVRSSVKKVYAHDIDDAKTEQFIKVFSDQLKVIKVSATELGNAIKSSRILVTCTPAKAPYFKSSDINPGTFIAAVGADSEEKQELPLDLLVSNKVIADIIEQSITIGDFHHAIRQGLATAEKIYAEIGMIISNKKRGRESDDEIIIYDSTGTALQDAAAAALVYEKALSKGIGKILNLS